MQLHNRRRFLQSSSLALAFAALTSGHAFAAEVPSLDMAPSELPPWKPGLLDIHHISTGRGSCAFLVCPDATTLMIDAGSILTHFLPSRDKYLVDPRPNASLRTGQWIARYVQRCLSEAGRREIDYVVLTHFHEDHIGEVNPGDTKMSPRSKLGAYQLGGLTDVAEVIPIRTIIDRNYPGYNYPAPLVNPQVSNYRAFGRSFMQRGGHIERIVPGALNQIKLTQTAKMYPGFSIRNLAANGEVWIGKGEETRHCFPPLHTLMQVDYPTENKCSLAIRLDYGKFSYFSGGDLDHETEYGRLGWGDIEAAVARASGPVQIAVADHHGFVDACGPDWVRALRAKIYVINGWDSAHPTMTALNNMLSEQLYPGSRLVFSTATKPESMVAVRRLAEMASQNGHVIFRIAEAGDTYQIFVKDSAIEDGKLIGQYGPFFCRLSPH